MRRRAQPDVPYNDGSAPLEAQGSLSGEAVRAMLQGLYEGASSGEPGGASSGELDSGAGEEG